MKNKLIVMTIALVIAQSSYSQETENSERIKIDYLKTIEISKKEQNEFTGSYVFKQGSDLRISVEVNEGKMAIIIPDVEKSKNGMSFTTQYTLLAQYKDKFYVDRDEIIKVHFTRSKKTGKVISLLYNARKVEGTDIIRATRAIK